MASMFFQPSFMREWRLITRSVCTMRLDSSNVPPVLKSQNSMKPIGNHILKVFSQNQTSSKLSKRAKSKRLLRKKRSHRRNGSTLKVPTILSLKLWDKRCPRHMRRAPRRLIRPNIRSWWRNMLNSMLKASRRVPKATLLINLQSVRHGARVTSKLLQPKRLKERP